MRQKVGLELGLPDWLGSGCQSGKMVVCTSCAELLYPPGAKFCAWCGTAAPQWAGSLAEDREALRAMRELPGDRGTPEMLTRNVGGTVDAAALRGEYRSRVALSADKHCRLAEVTSCWRKQPDGSVGEQCDCPPHVMKGRDNGRCASLVVAQLGQCLAADKR